MGGVLAEPCLIQRTYSLHVTLTYTDNQPKPSPVLMPSYHTMTHLSDAQFFNGHATFPRLSRLDFSGKQVDVYNRYNNKSKWIAMIATAFNFKHRGTEELFHLARYDLNLEALKETSTFFDDHNVRHLVSQARDFQRDAVRKWNPYAENVTLHVYLGLVAMDEDTSMENMALALDLCAKFGLLVKNSEGKWEVSPDADAREVIFIGDVKTVDSLDKAIRDQERLPPSSKVTLVTSDVFCNVMNRLHICTGDWHASMCMLQSVPNVFRNGFLKHFKYALKWQHCGDDVMNTYSNNCKLTHIVYEVCSSYLFHSFISLQS